MHFRAWSLLALSFLFLLFLGTPSDLPAAGRVDFEKGERVAFVGGTFFDRARSYGFLETLLTTQHPNLHLKFRNLSWPGDTVQVQLRPLNFGTLEDHLRAQNSSLVFLAYGLSEAHAGPDGLEEFREACRRLLRLVRRAGARPVLIGPIRHEKESSPSRQADSHNRNLRLYVRSLEDLARAEDVVFVDLFQDQGSGPVRLTENGIHLNQTGYWQAALRIREGIGQVPPAWRVDLDLETGTVRVAGTALTALSLKSPVHFQTLDTALPFRPPLPRVRAGSRRHLRVSGLSPGTYEVWIDGELVGEGDHRELARGISLEEGPEYRQAEAVRQLILEKNRRFFYRWRAHNGEYIYGRRSTTDRHIHGDRGRDLDGRGNAGNPQFETELAELDRLIRELEAAIHLQAQPRPHSYELRPMQVQPSVVRSE